VPSDTPCLLTRETACYEFCVPKILLIDDDQTFLNAMTALIMTVRIDIAVDTALCAEAGLLLVGVTDYDVIISDVRMPGLDGLRLVRECKRLRPNTPVVLVTGYGDQDVEAKALHLGAYAFIHKPVQPDMLLSLIERAIQRTHESKPGGSRESGSVPSNSLFGERESITRKIQEISRRIEQHLERLGNDTVH
jgi:DNA-binding NtrC family response regulator